MEVEQGKIVASIFSPYILKYGQILLRILKYNIYNKYLIKIRLKLSIYQ